MANFDRPGVRSTLLRRRGLVFVTPAGDALPDDVMKAFELELAELGCVMSTALSDRVRSIPVDAAASLRSWLVDELADAKGAAQTHTPLFRAFPSGIPRDTTELWVRRVISHFAQAPAQPCLFCGETGTTHVLRPCHHVVCDHCFDGSNYSGCPICGSKVDTGSPFFRESELRGLGDERARFELLHLGDDLDTTARQTFEALCARVQPLTPDDRADLVAILEEYGSETLRWVPDEIPLRENIATVFGVLFAMCDPDEVLDVARGHMTTATDVLRFIKVFSGSDAALFAEERVTFVQRAVAPHWLVARIAKLWGKEASARLVKLPMQRKIRRFRVAKLRRALRRALLALMDGMQPDLLVEDMLRHRSYWVWVGEFLHPGEYAKRFPNATRGFEIVRGGREGQEAPRHQTFAARVEAAARARDACRLADVLSERPGDFARRLDHALRLCTDVESADYVSERFGAVVGRMATPVLVTLRSLLPTRTTPAAARIFWPAGNVASVYTIEDRRPPLDPAVVARLVAVIETELLRRFGELENSMTWVIDEKLADIVVPFNERAASSAAVTLTRGSVVDIPTDRVVRLFMHWCCPEKDAGWTDLDLSVLFFNEDWKPLGTCSFYQLTCIVGGVTIAKSSGDFTSAPWPDGASEFVDIDCRKAAAHRVRYAVMVVNAYSGLPMSMLERAYAGVMLRDDVDAAHFDPRTVELKFGLDGANGVFLPLVFDVQRGEAHWFDTYNRGEFHANTAQSSLRDVVRFCPNAIDYFASGARPSVLDLGKLHAAARADEVFLRGEALRRFQRLPNETSADFLKRFHTGEGGEVVRSLSDERVTALLYRGDLTVADGSDVYAVFRDQMSPNLTASDLLA